MTAGTSPEQQAAPQEQAAAKEPAATQVTTVRSGQAPAPAVAPFDTEQGKRHQEAWAAHLGVPVTITNSIGMKLMLIPPGEFLMGTVNSSEEAMIAWMQAMSTTNPDRQISEFPQHKVRIGKPFYLGVTEVTQEHYQQVMKHIRIKPDGSIDTEIEGDAAQLAQGHLTWTDAVRFCERLSANEHQTYRLPTEAEWEYACRAGTTTRWSFGGSVATFEDYAWMQQCRSSNPSCGTKKAKQLGASRHARECLGMVQRLVRPVLLSKISRR